MSEEPSSAPAVQQNGAISKAPKSVKDFLALPQFKERFEEILGRRAPQFMASLVSVASQSNLANCEPKSVIASAMVAATLDLPIEKSLGFAHIVPYGQVAQFQMAAKGYIQLALRSGQYQRMNAKPINAEAFGGYDEVGEPIILWKHLDETKPIVGYACAWKLSNGFIKVAYWPTEKVEAHAAKFSQAYKKKKMDSPWFTNFDKMAIKTVVMNELRAWGILSVQMQSALRHDMGSQADIDAEIAYVDGENEEPAEPQQRIQAPAKSTTGAAGAVEEKKTRSKKATAPVDGDFKMENKDAAPAGPVTALGDKESKTFICKVVEFQTSMIESNGVSHPSVRVQLDGDFKGYAIHLGGATQTKIEGTEGAHLVANPAYQLEKPVAITLMGKKRNPAIDPVTKAETPRPCAILVEEVKLVESAPAPAPEKPAPAATPLESVD